MDEIVDPTSAVRLQLTHHVLLHLGNNDDGF